jgi:hypothetical protein
MATAAGNGKPAVIVWNMGPFHSASQQRIAFAEAYSAGAVCQNSRDPDIKRTYHEFLAQHDDVFSNTESLANVGVVISLWSRAFHEIPRNQHAAWWFGQMLLDTHVPFDYLIAERDLTPEKLRRYKTLVLPNVACLTDEQLDVLRTFVNEGSSIYSTGETGKYDGDLNVRPTGGIQSLASVTDAGAFRKEVGQGRVAFEPGLPEKSYWDANPRDPDKKDIKLEMPKAPDKSVSDALAWVLRDSLPLRVEAKPSTAIVPKRQQDRLILHLVNYNTYPDGKTLTPDTNLSVTVALPEGQSVKQIAVLSPDDGQSTTIDKWTAKNGTVTFTLPKLQHYSIAVATLQPAGPAKQ